MNVLFITVDQLRDVPEYTSPELREWMKFNLPAQNFLKEIGVNFRQHRVGSIACAPSRATLHTGQYPSLHGVSQTNGLAKEANDPDMFWLGLKSIPTWGNHLRNEGYQTYYRGKWHITNSELYTPGTINPVMTFDEDTGALRIDKIIDYKRANPLSYYGFDGWVGPEPHGNSAHSTGSSASVGSSGRDEYYSAEICNLIKNLETNKNKKPWAIVASFVNPHDIAMYGEITKRDPSFDFSIDPTLPQIPPAPSHNDTLLDKPSCQLSYREIYPFAFQPTSDTEDRRKIYFTLQKKVDQEIMKVLNTLFKSSFAKNTIIIFTSDHGEYLGAHGLLQKWYSAYEEAIKIPLTIYVPGCQPKDCDLLTSHIDIVPTILGLLNINENDIMLDFIDSKPLVGRDLSPILRGCNLPDLPQYFMTDDNITKGLHKSIYGLPFPAVKEPSNIETLIVKIKQDLYKFSRYFNNPRFSGTPVNVLPTSEEVLEALQTPKQYELYNLTMDPYEMINLYHTISMEKRILFEKLLDEQVQMKRLYPIDNVLVDFTPNFPPPE